MDVLISSSTVVKSVCGATTASGASMSVFVSAVSAGAAGASVTGTETSEQAANPMMDNKTTPNKNLEVIL
jgi:hypothetical protein